MVCLNKAVGFLSGYWHPKEPSIYPRMESVVERLGPSTNGIRESKYYNTFLGRVKLLVISLKAFLGDYPLQGIRLKSITRTADEVSKVCEDWGQYSIQVRSNPLLKTAGNVDHIFYQRISLLAVMAKSVVAGNPLGYDREKIIRTNIGYIVEALQFDPQEEFTKFLKNT